METGLVFFTHNKRYYGNPKNDKKEWEMTDIKIIYKLEIIIQKSNEDNK